MNHGEGMKTPPLIDVPKDSPSRKEKIKAFKLKHGIETHYSAPSDEMPWAALHLPTARKVGCGVTAASDMADCIAKACRVLDDADLIGYGKTEREAVRECCKAVGVVCGL